MKLFRKTVAVTAAIALAGTMLAFSPKANAATVAPTNLDGLSTGTQIAAPWTSHFTYINPFTNVHEWIGTITGTVDYQSDVYTYKFAVTPGDGDNGTVVDNNMQTFRTYFDVLGFNNVAGWSYSDAATAGGAGDSTAFAISTLPGGYLRWTASPYNSTFWWDGGSKISFFFQSYVAPTGPGIYNISDDKGGPALNYSVVPTPASALLAVPALALLGLGYMIRRRNQQLV